MSLFSICLHFLRCSKSCDKNPSYCKGCSRVRENIFYECNTFSNLCLCTFGSFLDIRTSERLDLDVFLVNASDNLNYTKDNGKCCYFQVFEFAHETCLLLFVQFLSECI